MECNRKPVVAVNQRGEAVAYYDSAMEASRMSGINVNNLYKAINHGTRCYRLRWLHEADYRTLWMEGRTDELRFSNREIHSDRTSRQWKGMDRKRKEERCRRISERKKELFRQGRISLEHAVKARSRPLICFNTGEEFPSVTAFARSMGLHTTNVSKAIRLGRRIKGLVVMYKDGNINKKK